MEKLPFDLEPFLRQTVFTLGNRDISMGSTIVYGLVVLFLAVALMVWLSWRRSKRLAEEEAARRAVMDERAREAELRMAELIATQNELTGRMTAMSENLAGRQSELAKVVHERLEGMSGKLGESITQTTKNTQESLAKLQERLAVIDTAQTNITSLTGQVVELQNILANKQTRGAFGEARMQAIVEDGLPQGSYEFQATLSTGVRPDCVVSMPNNAPSLVIDAKFPLESWNAFRNGDTDEASKAAAQLFRRDMEHHIKAISEKYLIKGETQDTAFLFVPSESIFADIHENFEGVVQKAHRARVVIVSPSLLMLSIQVVQSVLKDARMREQAHVIQGELVRLMEDVNRLDDRVRKLGSHFNMAQKDVEQILTSTEKVTRRGTKITDLDFEETKKLEGQASLKLVE